jgi:beta-1,2-mannosidase
MFKYLLSAVILSFALFACKQNSNIRADSSIAQSNDSWMLNNIEKRNDVYPILVKDSLEDFFCPVLKQNTHWQESFIFNPAAIVKDGKVYLIFRGEDRIGKYGGTSRIGIAESSDGINFKKHEAPILFPDNDEFLIYENEGGIEDPRIVERREGGYIMTYTAFDGKRARLCVATSDDLFSWKKQGLAFGKVNDGIYRDLWSKSGSIVCKMEGDKLLATRIDGKYWMYWGETDIFLATSDNLIDWEPVIKEEKTGKLLSEYLGNGHYEITFGPSVNYFKSAVSIRNKRFDSGLVEPGPPAIITEKGILLIYNASNNSEVGDTTLAGSEYTVGQILFDLKDPSISIARCTDYFLRSESTKERTGQMNNTAFVEGMAYLNKVWYLYYVTGEANIGVAVSNDAL